MNDSLPARLGAALLAFGASFLLVRALLPAPTASAVDALAPTESERATEAPGDGALAPTQLANAAAEAAAGATRHAEPERNREAATSSVATPAPAAAASGLLFGTITLRDGGALEEAMTFFRDDDGVVHRGRADAAGRYAMSGVPFGVRDVSVYVKGYVSAETAVELTAERPTRRVDFALDPQPYVRVDIVAPDGSPGLLALKGQFRWYDLQLVPVATLEPPGATFTEVTGSLNNPFGVGGYWDPSRYPERESGPATYGFIDLQQPPPVYVSLVAAHQVLDTVPVERSGQLVTFEVEAEDFEALFGEVHARVVAAESGEPLACTVELNDDPFANYVGASQAPDGEVRLERALPGARHLIVTAEGRAELVLPVRIERGRSTDLGTLELHEPVRLSGNVRAPDGSPVVAKLRWGRVDTATGEVAWVRQRSAESQPDGSFELNGLEPGLWIVQSPGLPARSPKPFDANRRSAPVRADATAGSVDGLEIVMQPTTRVVLATGDLEDPWATARVFDERGLRTNSTWLGRWGATAELQLAPGTYELVVKRGGVELERRALVVGAEPQRIELAIE